LLPARKSFFGCDLVDVHDLVCRFRDLTKARFHYRAEMEIYNSISNRRFLIAGEGMFLLVTFIYLLKSLLEK